MSNVFDIRERQIKNMTEEEKLNLVMKSAAEFISIMDEFSFPSFCFQVQIGRKTYHLEADQILPAWQEEDDDEPCPIA